MTLSYRRATLLATALLLLSLCPVALKVADAAGGRGAGLARPYTTTGCDTPKPTDPINVVWYQSSATPGNVAYQLKRMGWSHNDYNSPLALLFHAIDYQYVNEIGGCFRDDRQAATGSPISSRNHVRLFSTVNARGTQYVAGDAHHDKVIIGHGCKKALGHAGHIADTFDVAREQIVEYWPEYTPKKYRFWGNTRRMRQCNGSYTGSDGYVVYLKTNIATSAGHSYHPDNTAAPTIAGTPIEGQTLTASPGTWSDPAATTFAYQWCEVNLDTDACRNIDGATSDTYTPPTGSSGRVISVKVRPTGSTPSDAALAEPVTIGAASGSPPTLVVGGGWIVRPDVTVTTGGLDTTVTWFRQCGFLDSAGHPTDTCQHASTIVSGSVTGTVLEAFGPEDPCNNEDYWVTATNAAGTVWSDEIIYASYCN